MTSVPRSLMDLQRESHWDNMMQSFIFPQEIIPLHTHQSSDQTDVRIERKNWGRGCAWCMCGHTQHELNAKHERIRTPPAWTTNSTSLAMCTINPSSRTHTDRNHNSRRTSAHDNERKNAEQAFCGQIYHTIIHIYPACTQTLPSEDIGNQGPKNKIHTIWCGGDH